MNAKILTAFQKPLDEQPILRLGKHLRESGLDTPAAEPYYAFRRRRNAEKWRIVRTGLRNLRPKNDDVRKARSRGAREVMPFLGDCLYSAVCRYGVRPYRLLGAWLVLLVLGTLMFAHGDALALKDAKGVAVGVGVGWPAAFGEALAQLIPGASLIVGDPYVASQAHMPWPLTWMTFGALAAILQIAAWILVPIGLLVISGLLRRSPR